MQPGNCCSVRSRGRRRSARAVVRRTPDSVVGADLMVVEVALLPSAGRRPASELQASTVAALHGEVTHDDSAADSRMADAAIDRYVGREECQAIGLVVGKRVGQAVRRGSGGARGRCGSLAG